MGLIAQIFIACVALLMAYAIGHIAGRARRGSTIALADHWPSAHVQFDPEMSQEDMLRFIASVEATIRAGRLTKTQGLENSGACDQRD
ncbi:hypothetical protein B7H18_04560 [Pseudomonas putida]|nr:hypothetical protein B7H18_04560 [Pseudomonas putida]